MGLPDMAVEARISIIKIYTRTNDIHLSHRRRHIMRITQNAQNNDEKCITVRLVQHSCILQGRRRSPRFFHHNHSSLASYNINTRMLKSGGLLTEILVIFRPSKKLKKSRAV